MSELQTRFIDDTYAEYFKTGKHELAQIYLKQDVDKVIADLEESHKMEVGQLLMKIKGLEKLVETADKLLKQKGGFMIKDVTFDGVKLEGVKDEP